MVTDTRRVFEDEEIEIIFIRKDEAENRVDKMISKFRAKESKRNNPLRKLLEKIKIK